MILVFLEVRAICEGMSIKFEAVFKISLFVCERRVNLINTVAKEGVFQNTGVPLVRESEVWVSLHFAASTLGATKSSTLDP